MKNEQKAAALAGEQLSAGERLAVGEQSSVGERFCRMEMVYGAAAMQKLKNARVAVFGAGGVGGYIIEALARAGIGTLDIIDNDTVSISNINRQILALSSTVGRLKVEVAKERVMDINPDIKVNTYPLFYGPQTSAQFDFTQYDYVADAIDSVSGKIELVMQAEKAGTPIICCMGAGNKTNAAALEVSDIYKTSVCPLARVMRHELKKRGVKKLKVVYSKEIPAIKTSEFPGSTSFVPPVAGLLIAGEIVNELVNSAI